MPSAPHPLNITPHPGLHHNRPLLPLFSCNELSKSPIYACSFSDDTGLYGEKYFGTVAGRNISLYKIAKRGVGGEVAVELVQIYTDEDEGEEYYAIAFGGVTNGLPFDDDVSEDGSEDGDNTSGGRAWSRCIAVAGTGRSIKIINPMKGSLMCTLQGHGDEVYDLRFCGTTAGGYTAFNEGGDGDDSLLLSCSKDESVRFWDVRSGACLAIFAGEQGHRERVLSFDIHPTGGTFVSSGLDTSVRIWQFDESDVLKGKVREAGESLGLAPEASSSSSSSSSPSSSSSSSKPFTTAVIQFPVFTTNKVHTDYVDCVKFVGDSILSKSVTNSILLWNPVFADAANGGGHANSDGDIIPLREFALAACDVWFIRFAVDSQHRFVGCGNRAGLVKVWSLDPEEAGAGRVTDASGQLANAGYKVGNYKAANCNSTVRMVCFEEDYLLVCCDDGGVFLYDFDL
jgi:polycomb protein EED